MLSRKILSSILGEQIPQLDIRDIHWRSQDSGVHSILFYHLGSDSGTHEQMAQRLKDAQFGWLVVNRTSPFLPPNATVITQEQWLPLQQMLLDELYPLPQMKMIAITGTNGKTTTTDLVLQLGQLAGKKGMSIGTLGVRDSSGLLQDFGLTSPNFIDLRKFLNIYGQHKDFCVLEASSHALDQDRLHGLEFEAAGWLSFSQDHLDYHDSMDAYFNAKCLLLKHLRSEASIFVPAEQDWLFTELAKRSAQVRKAAEIYTELPLFFKAHFNRNNLEVALAIVEAVFSLKLPAVFEELSAPAGRFYIRNFKASYIIVDFAHTPDALENICAGIKEAFPAHRLKVLFGCGGDRDRHKRPQMARVAEKWSEAIYLTSDNPRNEDPEKILDDIVAGLGQQKPIRITDRPTAVKHALNELMENEVLLLAGKGHEDYILIKGIKYPYSDIQQVEEFLAKENI